MFDGPSNHVSALLKEAGGHRWQRVPPTERKGRVHTSTVTVAAFVVTEKQEWKLHENDIKTFTTKGTGPGGQHRNKVESCVVMRHLPTGIEATASTKSQFMNKQIARAMLETRVREKDIERERGAMAAQRKQQVGSGMRGDKIRTYRQQDDIVTDHITGKKFRLKDFIAGKIPQ